MSKASNKSVKSINASLEKTHTFGMSNIHKNKFDIYKIDKDFETNDKKAQLPNTVPTQQIRKKQGKPMTTLKFLDPKSIDSDMEDGMSNSEKDLDLQ